MHYLVGVNRLALLIISQSGLQTDEYIVLKYENLNFLHKTIRVDVFLDSYHSMTKEAKTQNAKQTLSITEKARDWVRI